MEQNLFGNRPIVVTGASGLVGAHLCFSLLRHGCIVRAVVRNEQSQKKAESFFTLYDRESLLDSHITWVYADVTHPLEVAEAIEGAEYVFHCAGYVSFNLSDISELYEINTIATRYVVDACLKYAVKKLCYVSSIAALGTPAEHELLDETREFNKSPQQSPYGYSKYHGELEVWRGIAEGLPSVIVNPSVIIGPGQWFQSSGELFSTVSQGMMFYTSSVSGYVSIHDVVDAMITLMKSDVQNERFIVSAQDIDIRTVFSTIAETLNVRKPTVFMPKLLFKTFVVLYSCCVRLIGKTPRISLQTVETAYSKMYIDNSKIKKYRGEDFRDVLHELKTTALFFAQHCDSSSKK
ncbi:MAG: NAD-dependent epimerase/dehydratase family protein [Bacteroidales bacterium]|nr:NAD-dependent epimerase/dehydratase family protein [Bacteroidales bacterium]